MIVFVAAPPRYPWQASTVLIFVPSVRHLSLAWTVPVDFSGCFSMRLKLPVAVASKVRKLRFFLP